ncbi:MAG: DUF4440 domain-containing protein [Bacteroidota bacterium]
MKTRFFTVLAYFLILSTHGQYPFEPSIVHPFGLPNPDAPKELLDFAPLIGECNCTSQVRKADQTWAEPVPMTWRFKYIMNGMAIQDETLKTDGTYSGSIRQFIPDSTRWYVHYYSFQSPSTSLPTWEGNRTTDGKIVLYREQKAPNGMDGSYRLTFYAINEQGFKWIGEWVDPTASVVFPTWKIDCSNGKMASKSKHEMDKAKIIEASNNFSKAYRNADLEALMNVYTEDAKIFPTRLDILEGEQLKEYWTPKDNGYKIVHHKITSEQLQFFGNYAHDYGYYEGKTQKPDGTVNDWKGKYVVIWRKENDQWKMYLDIWNGINN